MPNSETSQTRLTRFLNAVERVGNRLPDPAMLFVLLLVVVLLLSWYLSGTSIKELDPRSGQPLQIVDMLSAKALATFMSKAVSNFATFPPMAVVLVAILGLGVAEHAGFISAVLRSILSFTPRALLTPVLIAVGILSHIAVDAGYVLVIPLGAVIFYAAGRHPLAGIAAAFAGVSGGFSASLLIPSSLDPLLAGLTQASARLSALPAAAALSINPLNNFYFTSASSVLIIAIGWFLTDRVIEPRLKDTAIDGDLSALPTMDGLQAKEKAGLVVALIAMVLGLLALAYFAGDEKSVWRAADGTLTHGNALLMQSIVSFILVFFLVPGVLYGYIAGTIKTHRDLIQSMAKSMAGMGYYLVMAFFCAQFLYVFSQSNLGVLLSIKGANFLKEMSMPSGTTVVGIVFLTAFINLVVGSASAKWAIMGAVMVPMLMELGISPDFTQAAYRIGDSTTNIVSPLMPYFPLMVVFAQRYVKSTGIGSLIALMLPFSATFLVVWTGFLIGFWALDIPLGLGASYAFPAGG